MRIRVVRAQAFGALHDAILPLAPGLTVVYGPNEAGKSTWHAAMLAALCGRRDTSLDRYAPWEGDRWSVSAEIELADGRCIEMRQDLAARHGWATDLTLGSDCAPEITARGKGEVPDATRWLGLERRAFVATACVRQSDLRLATSEADGLRHYVERAAGTAHAEETAAAALSRLETFQREQVGTDRTTTRPLQVAQRSVVAASAALEAARAQRDALATQSARAAALRAAADAAALRLARAEAAAVREQARRLGERAALAASLSVAGPAAPAPLPTPAPGPAAPAAGPAALTPLPATPPARRRQPWWLIGAVAALLAGALLLASAVTVGGVVAIVVGLVLAGLHWRRTVASRPPAAPTPEWLAARDAETARRARLDGLLEGRSLDDLVAEAAAAARRAELLGGSPIDGPLLDGSLLDGSLLDGSPLDGSPVDGPGDVDDLRQQHVAAERLAAQAELEVQELARRQTPVAEAEVALAEAQSALARLEELDDVLSRTREYLSRAQARVYRDIAPRLALSVGRELARATDGRYTEAFVDPGSLAVRVRGVDAPVRDTSQLSLGTAEQVYLLLRVALAEHLVRAGESCPLLLDDVTVHADVARTARLLDVLHSVAERHQVVLFTQQPQVLEWARSRVDGHRHALVELAALAPV